MRTYTYMYHPKGFSDSSEKVCKLQKSLYGLMQASRCWNKKFSNFLKDNLLIPSQADLCVFLSQIEDRKIIIALYIDDGLIAASNEKDIHRLLKRMQDEFEIEFFDIHYYFRNEKMDLNIYTNDHMQDELFQSLI